MRAFLCKCATAMVDRHIGLAGGGDSDVQTLGSVHSCIGNIVSRACLGSFELIVGSVRTACCDTVRLLSTTPFASFHFNLCADRCAVMDRVAVPSSRGSFRSRFLRYLQNRR